MELDNLKNIWRSLDKELPDHHDDEQIAALIGKQSQSPIAKMRHNLLIEFIMVVVMYGACVIYYFIAFEGRMAEVSWFMLVAGLFFLVYYFRKNKLLNKMQCLSCHVRSNLETQVSTLEKYIRFYLIAGTLLAPGFLIFLSFLLYYKVPSLKVFINNPFWKIAPIWLITISMVTLIVYLCNRWYINKLYGRHIKGLRKMLEEMNEGA